MIESRCSDVSATESTGDIVVRDVPFRLTLGLYYLALGIWIGATGMIAVSAGLTFVTLRQAGPTLTEGPGGNPELAAYTADYLAGNAVNPAFTGLTFIQAGCALILLLVIVLQATLWRDRQIRRGHHWINILRLGAIGAALALFLADGLITRDTMDDLRGQMYRPGVTVEQYEQWQQPFQQLHQRSARAQLGMAGLLAAAGLLSPFVFIDRRPDSSENTPHG